MSDTTLQSRHPEPVRQFSVFTANRLGRLRDLVTQFAAEGLHVLAITVLDTTDSSIIRLVVNDPDKARRVLNSHGFPFTESDLVVVEVTNPGELTGLMSALLEAELNVHYLYSFIPHQHGKSLVALSMEDNEMAEQILKKHQFTVLRQSDISR